MTAVRYFLQLFFRLLGLYLLALNVCLMAASRIKCDQGVMCILVFLGQRDSYSSLLQVLLQQGSASVFNSYNIIDNKFLVDL